MDVRALSAMVLGLLVLGSGCTTTDAQKGAGKRPDVTQPGVLPPPQEAMKPASGVVPAGGTQAATLTPRHRS